MFTIYRRGAAARAVPDGFSWGGFVFGPLWLLREGSVAAALILLLLWLLAFHVRSMPFEAVLALGAGLFGQEARALELRCGGWRAAGSAAGLGPEHALLRHAEGASA